MLMRNKENDEVRNDALTIQHIAEPVILLTVEQVAKRLDIGVRTVWRLDKDNKLPAPVRLGHRKRWKADEIELWLHWNCPDRKDFEQCKTKERVNNGKGKTHEKRT
jgi:excisionase family DNA binding protein